jgi:regulator of RNase E activity RraB
MTKSILSLAVVSALSIGLTGCGGGSSSDSTTNVEVERGKIYDATVTDSSTPVKTATATTGSNIYKFDGTPTYPIRVTGGWIDVDGDGEMSSNDIENDLELTSYSTVVTPVTTFLADGNESVRAEKLAALLEDLNVTEDELMKVPSKANNKAIILNNAVYKAIQENSDSLNNLGRDEIRAAYTTVETIFTQSVADSTDGSSANLAKALELQVVNSMPSYVATLDQDAIDAFEAIQEDRDREETPSTSSGSLDTTKDIIIYKNFSANIDDEDAEDLTPLSTSTTCTGLGYSFYHNMTSSDFDSDLNGATGKIYYNSTSHKSCIEIDGSSTSYSGSNSYYLYDIDEDDSDGYDNSSSNDTPIVDIHGDTMSEATPFTTSTINGTVDASGDDFDYFKIILTQSSNLELYTTGSVDTTAYLYNSLGANIAEDDDSGEGYNFNISENLTAGTYYLRVSNYSGSQGSYVLNKTVTTSSSSSSSSTSSSDTILNMSSYDIIYTYKNIDEGTKDIFIQVYQDSADFEYSSNPVDCASLSGYTQIGQQNTAVNGAVITTYSSSDYTHLCYESDYANASTGSGSSNLTVVYNN